MGRSIQTYNITNSKVFNRDSVLNKPFRLTTNKQSAQKSSPDKMDVISSIHKFASNIKVLLFILTKTNCAKLTHKLLSFLSRLTDAKTNLKIR